MMTCLYDGHHFLHRMLSVASLHKKAETGGSLDFRTDPAGDRRILLRKMSDVFASEVSKFIPECDQVVYCVDSYSWRKRIPGEDYKGNRKKDDTIDWRAIGSAHSEFQEALSAQGVHVSRVDGAEADDLLFHWSKTLNRGRKRDVVVVSGDGDLNQVVGKDPLTGASTIVYNKVHGALRVYSGFSMDMDADPSMQGEVDIFESANVFSGGGWKSLVKKLGCSLSTVDPVSYLFVKVIFGDPGDNVKSVFQRTKDTRGGPRTYRITEKVARAILDEFEKGGQVFTRDMFFDDAVAERVSRMVSERASVDPSEPGASAIADRWRMNRDMVLLDHRCIPQEVTSGMEEDYSRGSSTFIRGISSKAISQSCPTLAEEAPPLTSDRPSSGFNPNDWNFL